MRRKAIRTSFVGIVAAVLAAVTPATAGATVSFTPAFGSPFAVGTNPFSVAIADVNGDGKPDLATANRISSSVSVLQTRTRLAGAPGTRMALTAVAIAAVALLSVAFFMAVGAPE